ncbi:MAG: hypothetical protein DIU78_013885 [Pseudomonadota bacterium]|nr:MAG: hypothetical protein DIU78_18360 [Pseudomonadota bacterium]
MEARPVLLFGRFREEDLGRLSHAAEQAACVPRHVESIEEALAWLEEYNEAQGLLCNLDESEQLVVQTRSLARFSRLPVLAIAEPLGDLAFVSAFSWGADDVLPLAPERPLVTRLRALPKQAPPLPQDGRGAALVAEADRTRRAAVARVLRNAGFSVRFAVSPEDAEQFARDPSLSLVVAGTELVREPSATIRAARSEGSDARFILCCPPRALKQERAQLGDLSGVTATDGFASPENVLFVANELLMGARTNGRTSPRVAYGTLVAFRGAGREVDERGFTYNVSANGIYVRTLALPEDDEVWLELCPPAMDRRVRLVGRVAWRRPFGYSETATVPPGFGVQIVDGAQRDLALWKEGYEQLLATVG